MPTNNAALSNIPLRDIHLPDAISWWPLAIGWWLLPIVIIVCASAIYAFLQYRKNHKKPAYKKMAMSELKNIKLQYKNNSVECVRAISALLRRIALSYLPRESIASLTGEQWVKQLNQLSSQTLFSPETAELLEKAPYMKDSPFQTDELLQLCEQWIKSLPEAADASGVKP